MTLVYCVMTAHINCNEHRHPQEVMRELGITYHHATPQSISEQWLFWSCAGVPGTLPKFLKSVNLNPYAYVGQGLTSDDADMIHAGE